MLTGTGSAGLTDGGDHPDEQVVRDVLDGKTAMFELLMRRYNERVYRAARAIVRDDHEAEDVMQQAYVNAFTHLRQFNGSALFSTWLIRIAITKPWLASAAKAVTKPSTTPPRRWNPSCP